MLLIYSRLSFSSLLLLSSLLWIYYQLLFSSLVSCFSLLLVGFIDLRVTSIHSKNIVRNKVILRFPEVFWTEHDTWGIPNTLLLIPESILK